MASSLLCVRVKTNHRDCATDLKTSLDANNVTTTKLVNVAASVISSNVIVLEYTYYA